MTYYGITIAGGLVLHAVEGDLKDRRGWGEVTTLCGRHLVPINYFRSLDDYRRTYNCNGKSCQQGCQQAWRSADKPLPVRVCYDPLDGDGLGNVITVDGGDPIEYDVTRAHFLENYPDGMYTPA